jgi:hypothetical protein
MMVLMTVCYWKASDSNMFSSINCYAASKVYIYKLEASHHGCIYLSTLSDYWDSVLGNKLPSYYINTYKSEPEILRKIIYCLMSMHFIFYVLVCTVRPGLMSFLPFTIFSDLGVFWIIHIVKK